MRSQMRDSNGRFTKNKYVMERGSINENQLTINFQNLENEILCILRCKICNRISIPPYSISNDINNYCLNCINKFKGNYF